MFGLDVVTHLTMGHRENNDNNAIFIIHYAYIDIREVAEDDFSFVYNVRVMEKIKPF